MFRRRDEEVRRTDGQADPRRTAETEKNKSMHDAEIVLMESETIVRKIISGIVQPE